jgi:acetyltransferase
MLNNYTPHMLEYAAHGRGAEKPVVVLSPTAENTHPLVHEIMGEHRVPVLRGMRAGLVALRNLGVLGEGRAGAPPANHQRNAAANEILREIAGMQGPLAPAVTRRILQAYDIPLVRSAVAPDEAGAAFAAAQIGYPVVLKVVSSTIAHRSDVGGVAVGIVDAEALRAAMAQMRSQIGAALPEARIEGFEVQEHLVDWVEAMAGFIATPPFGALLTVGTGGTMVELLADGAVELCPISSGQAVEMIGGTRLGKSLGGYRNLVAKTDMGALANLVAALSRMAVDLCRAIGECDINPVLVRKRTGEVRVVDALLVGRS